MTDAAREQPGGSELASGDARLGLRKLLSGYVPVQIVSCAVRLGILDRLETGPCRAARLSEASGVPLARLERLLRALEGLRLLVAGSDEQLRLTEAGRLLTRSSGTLYGYALLAGGDYYEAWTRLEHALRTGESAFEAQHGQELWQRLATRPESAASFAKMMRQNTAGVGRRLLDGRPFPATGLLADLGAGDGSLLADLLDELPGWRGLAVEQAASAPYVQATLDERCLSNRAQLLVGNLLEAAPRGADIYVLKSVIHNWGDQDALRILQTCRRAMPASATLLVIERALDPESGASDLVNDAVQDLTMLVLFGARDRTAEEYQSLLRRGGFALERVFTIEPKLMVFEATPAAP